VFEIVEVVPDPGSDMKRSFMLRLRCRDEAKGPVTAVCGIICRWCMWQAARGSFSLDTASVALVVRAEWEEWEKMLKDTVAAGGHTVVVTVKYDINFQNFMPPLMTSTPNDKQPQPCNHATVQQHAR
jgi:hypothetical protein